MHQHAATWKMLLQNLQQDVAVMLLYVVESLGSSPGRKGFLMMVSANGEMCGSIGGGIMEHKFVELAKSLLQQGVRECSLHRQVHNKTAPAQQSGMICSGEQTIALYNPAANDIVAVTAIINAIENGWFGIMELSCSGIVFHNGNEGAENGLVLENGHWNYRERLAPANMLYIIGGGHCALALSKVMAMTDFYIHLLDDRAKLNTMEANHYADKKTIIDSFSEVHELIENPEDSYMVVMTFGYRTDDAVLRSLLNKRFKYLGVLGSSSKIQKMFDEYAKEGIDEDWLARISAPAGVTIESKTPIEIAISIAAEIIKVKNSTA